jgi:hypothetical protein
VAFVGQWDRVSGEAVLQETAEDLALWCGGFQRARNMERGYVRGYGHFEGELPLRSEGRGVLLQGPVFQDPSGQLRVDRFFDPLIE